MVEGLPVHTFPTDDGGVDMKCPTEIAITDRREAELAKNGFMPLIHKKNTDFAAFIGAQSLQKPFEYDDPDATANANLAGAAALPVRHLPVRALPQVHRPRQGRLVQGTGRHGEVAQQLDHAVCRARPANATEDAKAAPARGRRGQGRRGRGQPGLLQLEVLPASALPARGPDDSSASFPARRADPATAGAAEAGRDRASWEQRRPASGIGIAQSENLPLGALRLFGDFA
jgi:hypothetical protein